MKLIRILLVLSLFWVLPSFTMVKIDYEPHKRPYGKTNFSNIFADIADKFISNGDTNINDWFGNSLLICAAKAGDKTTVQKLLQAGAKLDTVNNAGFTALSVASQNGNEDIVQILLDKGAYILISDRVDKTPVEWAKTPQIRNILKKALQHRNETKISILREFEKDTVKETIFTN